jgi:hypothetical protein
MSIISIVELHYLYRNINMENISETFKQKEGRCFKQVSKDLPEVLTRIKCSGLT